MLVKYTECHQRCHQSGHSGPLTAFSEDRTGHFGFNVLTNSFNHFEIPSLSIQIRKPSERRTKTSKSSLSLKGLLVLTFSMKLGRFMYSIRREVFRKTGKEIEIAQINPISYSIWKQVFGYFNTNSDINNHDLSNFIHTH